MMTLVAVGVPVDLLVYSQLSLQHSLSLLRVCFNGVRERNSVTESDQWRRKMNVIV